MGWDQWHEVQQGQVPARPALGLQQPKVVPQPGMKWLEKCQAEKDLEVLVSSGHVCAQVAKNASGILAFISNSMDSGPGHRLSSSNCYW